MDGSEYVNENKSCTPVKLNIPNKQHFSLLVKLFFSLFLSFYLKKTICCAAVCKVITSFVLHVYVMSLFHTWYFGPLVSCVLGYDTDIVFKKKKTFLPCCLVWAFFALIVVLIFVLFCGVHQCVCVWLLAGPRRARRKFGMPVLLCFIIPLSPISSKLPCQSMHPPLDRRPNEHAL